MCIYIYPSNKSGAKLIKMEYILIFVFERSWWIIFQTNGDAFFGRFMTKLKTRGKIMNRSREKLFLVFFHESNEWKYMQIKTLLINIFYM